MIAFLFSFAGLLAAAPERELIDRHCVGCHNARTKTADLALDGTLDARTAEKVVRRLRARNMPPAGLPRPAEAVYRAAQLSLETTLDAAKPDPGRTETFRRLNRTEYRNAIRDLLALEVDVSNLLPADDASHGFDNVTVGELSPMLLERYLGAARKIARLAIDSGEGSGWRDNHVAAGPDAGRAF